MRARTITTIVVLAALAIPASASGYSSVNAVTGGSSDSNASAGGADYASPNAIAGGSSGSTAPGGSQSAPRVDPTYSSLNATTGADQPTVASTTPSSAPDGFDWGDAALGAGAAMALLALGGAVFLTVRRPKPVQPAQTTG